jgi:thiamine biosynthesis lipoprotein
VTSALVDASGDVAASGPPPESPGWRIAVRPLAAPAGTLPPLDLAHAAVTTSGDAFQAVEIDGVRYSHIVDPRTGLGVVGRSAVTVVAADCTTADAVATAASVLGPEAGLELVARTAGCSARFVLVEGGVVHEAISPSWPGGPAAGHPAFPNPRRDSGP